MKKEMYSVECEPDCEFMVKSHDKKELISVVKMHAKNAHNQNMSDDDIKAKIRTSGAY